MLYMAYTTIRDRSKTLKVGSMNRIEAFEMWLRITWISKTTNNELLQRANTDRELLTTIKLRKISYLRHVLQGEIHPIPPNNKRKN